MAYIVGVQREQSLGFARGGHELDFHCIRSKKFDDCAEIAAPQLSGGDIMCERDGIEQCIHELSRKRGYEFGNVFSSS